MINRAEQGWPEERETDQRYSLSDLWRISRTALSGMDHVPSRYERMQWTSSEYRKQYPELKPKAVWNELDALTR